MLASEAILALYTPSSFSGLRDEMSNALHDAKDTQWTSLLLVPESSSMIIAIEFIVGD